MAPGEKEFDSHDVDEEVSCALSNWLPCVVAYACMGVCGFSHKCKDQGSRRCTVLQMQCAANAMLLVCWTNQCLSEGVGG